MDTIATTRSDRTRPVWVNVLWLVIVAQGLAASAADVVWGRKIALPGLIDAAGIPMPWWTGLAMAILGGAVLLCLRRRSR